MLDVFVVVVILGFVILAARCFSGGVRDGLQNSNRPDPPVDDSVRNWYLLQQTANFASTPDPAAQPGAAPCNDAAPAVAPSQPDTSSGGSYDSGSSGFDSSGSSLSGGTDGGGFGGGGGDAF